MKNVVENLGLTQLSEADFNYFQQLIFERTGIFIQDKKRILLSNRIRKRLRALGMVNFNEYYEYLQNLEDKEEELIKMTDVITTNVTSFFRNPKQFNLLQNRIISDQIKRNNDIKSLRILSAGCSSGEEPYTIAIILLESYHKLLYDWDICIHACDISTQIIEKAKNGVYKKDKLTGVNMSILNKYFSKLDEDNYMINNRVKSLVKYTHFNLLSDEFPCKYDIILCRNVVIYFNKDTKNKIYQKFFDALNPKGYFLVGHSEGIVSDPRFVYISPSIYQKSDPDTYNSRLYLEDLAQLKNNIIGA